MMPSSGTRSPLRATLEERGYVVVPDVVPRENLQAVIDDIWRHTGADPADPETWYQPGLVRPTGMVQMYHYQSLWDNRQHPRVHAIFAEIFGTEHLWVSLDRANLKPPATPRHPEYDHRGFIHWDTDITAYPNLPFGVQGVLALVDTDEEMGGFQGVPEVYRALDSWVAERRGDPEALHRPDFAAYPVTKVPLRAGELVIWSTLLPHGNGHNVSPRPRLAQYVSMLPASEDEEARRRRVESWQTNAAAPGFPSDPRLVEAQRAQPAQLTALGRRLLGLDPWP
jgi:ectoine hydroxylase-related dioxygenase (phytanoyl-CoA dioxygenase family)